MTCHVKPNITSSDIYSLNNNFKETHFEMTEKTTEKMKHNYLY